MVREQDDAILGASDPSGGDRLAILEAENAELRSQVRQLSLVLDGAIDYAIITLDVDGLITGWNAGASRVTGYGAAEVLGRSGDIVFTAEDRRDGRFEIELCRAIEDGRAVNERWHLRRDGSRFWASGLMMPLLDIEGRPDGFLDIFVDRTEARAEADRRELMVTELNHRTRNTFAIIQAVAAQTGRHAETIEQFQANFAARLQVLARSQDVLIRGDWLDAPLQEVIDGALEAYRGAPDRIATEGVAVTLAAPLVVSMSLAFHELATNAIKYGALSVPTGHVDVVWKVIRDRPGAHRVDILWRERGGPPVQLPKKRGFGSQLFERGIPSGGVVKFDYLPEGLECRIILPLGVSPAS